MRITLKEYNDLMTDYGALLEMTVSAVSCTYLIETYSITTMDDTHVFLCRVATAYDGDAINPQELVENSFDVADQVAFKFDNAKECLAFANEETQRLTNLILERVGEFTA